MNCNSRHSLTFQVIHHQVNIWISHILYAGLQVKDGELAKYVCERYQRWHRHCELFKSSNLKCLCQNVVSGTSMIPDAFYVSNLITRGRMQCKTTAYKMLKHFQSYCVFWTFESIVENNQPTQPTNQKRSRAGLALNINGIHNNASLSNFHPAFGEYVFPPFSPLLKKVLLPSHNIDYNSCSTLGLSDSLWCIWITFIKNLLREISSLGATVSTRKLNEYSPRSLFEKGSQWNMPLFRIPPVLYVRLPICSPFVRNWLILT